MMNASDAPEGSATIEEQMATSGVTDPRPGELAYGRWIDDLAPLSDAELLLIARCCRGERCTFDESRPTAPNIGNSVRARVIRFLLLGGDRRHPVHERGVRLQGAWISEELNISACKIAVPLEIRHCHFTHTIRAVDSNLCHVDISSSYISRISADRMHVERGVAIRYCVIENDISVGGARIGEDLTFRYSEFLGRNSVRSLFADRSHVGGVLSLASVKSKGELRMSEGTIQGTLDCTGVIIEGRTQRSVTADPKGVALNVDGTKIANSLIFKDARVVGIVNLTALSVDTLVDDTSWPSGTLRLNGFTYNRIVGGPADADTRIEWLKKQQVKFLGPAFSSQPWEQVVNVLREMGHLEDAKRVAIAKQIALRRAGVIGQRQTHNLVGWRRRSNFISNLIARSLHRAYGTLAGFGYRPLKTVAWMAVLWFVAGIAYAAAERDGLFGPTNPRIFADRQFDQCGDGGEPAKQHWTRCGALPPEHTSFQPMMYSLDLILPLVDLKQDADWAPIVYSADGSELVLGQELRLLMWFEILSGWVGSLLLVSVIGRLIQKD